MAELVILLVGAGTAVLVGSIITTVYCCKHIQNYHQKNKHPTKYQHNNNQNHLVDTDNDDNLLHNVIINQNIAKHLQPLSLISNDSTMLAPSKRLAILERDQHDAQTMTVLENPYCFVHFTFDEKQPSSLIRSQSISSHADKQHQQKQLLLNAKTLPSRHHYLSSCSNNNMNNIYENNLVTTNHEREHPYAYENLSLELGELTLSNNERIQQF
ncbi:unnamed protein product [Didymodactylos carnosus]|uniref:Uncharacterized protein n=1 Tax=Didymodactylos carnosus TaxID=1234261 RepID=A0A814II55_9BILA|nr:unnamed protein product [Didymodactylos carnosus]CAF1404417.1 unnamed protein product [Didymodactylos carnosus]CAF3795675.1 unnamed protein product [Didymodactylos carnosus]CAF4210592.1 unnamed protein product [Didymodactylos carnosus]